VDQLAGPFSTVHTRVLTVVAHFDVTLRIPWPWFVQHEVGVDENIRRRAAIVVGCIVGPVTAIGRLRILAAAVTFVVIVVAVATGVGVAVVAVEDVGLLSEMPVDEALDRRLDAQKDQEHAPEVHLREGVVGCLDRREDPYRVAQHVDQGGLLIQRGWTDEIEKSKNK